MSGPRRVPVFFYGSYINPKVLAEVDLIPERFTVARLPGFDIHIGPLANLRPSPADTVYGVIAEATHDELDRLYTHARDVLGGVYRPEAVVCHDDAGRLHPALCYLADDLGTAPPAPDYVDRIVEPARAFGFPAWYVERLESFRP